MIDYFYTFLNFYTYKLDMPIVIFSGFKITRKYKGKNNLNH